MVRRKREPIIVCLQGGSAFRARPESRVGKQRQRTRLTECALPQMMGEKKTRSPQKRTGDCRFEIPVILVFLCHLVDPEGGMHATFPSDEGRATGGWGRRSPSMREEGTKRGGGGSGKKLKQRRRRRQPIICGEVVAQDRSTKATTFSSLTDSPTQVRALILRTACKSSH